MKKSIFLFFAAILCAMSANAKVVYLKLNDKWSASEARYYVHVWGGSSSNTSIEMQAVEGETNMYKIEVGTHNSIIFLRHKTTTTVTESNKWNNLLNRLGNLSIPEVENCCTIKNGVTTVENGNDNGAGSNVTWSTYTPAEPEPEPEPVETHDITVKAKYPATWTAGKAAIHFWGTGVTGTTPAAMTKDGDWWSYTVTGVPTTTELSVVFINGDNWSENKNQTVDITGITENTCFEISQSGTAKGTAVKADCETGEAEVVEDVYTVVGSDVLLGTAWDLNNADNEMTKQDDGSYVLVKENVDLATTGTYEYKVVKNHDYGWSVPQEGNLTLTGVDVDGTYNVTFTLNKELNALTTSLELVEAKKVIPECYIAGDESLTGQNWNGKSIQMIYDEATEIYTATLTAVPAGTHNMKVVYDGAWLGFDKLVNPAPANVTEGEDKKIKFTLAEAGDVTVTYHVTNGIDLTGNFAAPVTYDYYIAGTLAGGWSATQQGMEKDGELYKATFSELNAGEYQFKITDGQWNTGEDQTHEWNYYNLGVAYEEVSEGVNDEGNPNGNIKIVTEEAKSITVIFDATAGKITFEGLTEITEGLTYTVKTPWGTENCYIASATTGWNFRQMDPTDENRVFTITIVGAKETDEYKYARQPEWDFAEVREADENGNTNRKAWAERDTVDLWGTRTYTVAGNNAAVFGTEWDAENWDNDMTLQDDGTYVWTKPAVYLTGNVEFKVIKNQNWATAWPADNYVVDITEEAYYSLTIYYNPANNDITVVTNKLTVQTGSLTVDGVMLEETEFDGIWSLTGQTRDRTTGVTIFLENYTGEDKAYDVHYDSAIDWNYNYSSSVSGQLTQTTGADGIRTFTGVLDVVFEAYDEATDAMVGQPYELTVTLVEKTDEATLVVVTDATVTLEAGLTMTGEWTDEYDGTTYPVLVTVPGFDQSVASAELDASITVGGEGEDDPWLGWVEGPTTVTVEEDVVTVTGVLENVWFGVKLNVTISGTLPVVEEPEPDPDPTPDPEVTEITLTSGDNSALLAAADGKTVDVTVERSFTAGGLHTIALPFKLTNVAGVFGEGTVVYEFAELQLENNDLALYFDTTKTTIEAGKPYLIVPAQSVNGFEVDDATISAAPQPISFTVGNATVTMEPVLTVATNAKTNGKYWLASDTYLYNTSTALKSLCAVFDIQSQKSNVRARIAFNENAATGFDNIVAPEGQTIKAIVNGQLVIIRGGEMYNVQGQKL